MIRFECDYLEGAHPEIIEKLNSTNLFQTPGYGEDEYCNKAREIIKKLCNAPKSDVHFLVGGTQANTTVISSILRPYQGVLCAVSGHINIHETGAIEATGHKVLTLASDDGKITPNDVEKAYIDHFNDSTHEHIVQPGMVYISNPTENGTLYFKKELEELSTVCKKYNLPLYMDGARLGYGLMAEGYDVTLSDIAKLCDVFYIGGTKVGALFGEAVVIPNTAIQKDFRYMIKRQGGMFAKGRLLGLQFLTLFKNGLYFDMSSHADRMALKIKKAFAEKGYSFRYNSITNQQYPIIPNKKLDVLKENYTFAFWEKIDDNKSAVRFCTSWATKEEDVEKLINDIKEL